MVEILQKNRMPINNLYCKIEHSPPRRFLQETLSSLDNGIHNEIYSEHLAGFLSFFFNSSSDYPGVNMKLYRGCDTSNPTSELNSGFLSR